MSGFVRTAVVMVGLVVVAPATTARAQPLVYVDECARYSRAADDRRHELADFRAAVLGPLTEVRDQVHEEVERRDERPDGLRRRIDDEQRGIARHEREIENIEVKRAAEARRANALDEETGRNRDHARAARERGDQKDANHYETLARQAERRAQSLRKDNLNRERKISHLELSIERREAKIDASEEEIVEIDGAEPPTPDLRRRLEELERRLGRHDELREEIHAEIELLESAVKLCSDYLHLEARYRAARACCEGLP